VGHGGGESTREGKSTCWAWGGESRGSPRALAMARQWRTAMFDDSGWQTVVGGDARMVLQHRGAEWGEAQRKSMRNGLRAARIEEEQR
jgi:hypothetical protein